MDDLSYLAVTLVFSKTLILMYLGSGRRAVVELSENTTVFLKVCVCVCLFLERRGVIWGIMYSSVPVL